MSVCSALMDYDNYNLCQEIIRSRHVRVYHLTFRFGFGLFLSEQNWDAVFIAVTCCLLEVFMIRTGHGGIHQRKWFWSVECEEICPSISVQTSAPFDWQGLLLEDGWRYGENNKEQQVNFFYYSIVLPFTLLWYLAPSPSFSSRCSVSQYPVL